MTRFVLMALFLLIVVQKGFSQFSEVVKLTGNFSVSDAGSATYSIPITLPPGIGGMKPDLSLNYNSNGGNGLLGIGWAFSGMSVIARGSRTIEQDGVTYGIQFNKDDVYYLDGERLVQWNNTSEYGGDGTEYGTESNTFVKVVSKGVSGNGPGYFVVYTKSGLKLTFGRSASSKVFVPGTSNVLYYLLDKMEEYSANSPSNDSPTPNTNYITYEYEKDENNANYRPTRIRYTQNSSIAPGSNSSLTDVLFIYEDRNDKEFGYLNGIKSSVTKRLSQLRIAQNNDIKEIYNFYYTEYGQNQTTLLESVLHCMAETGECSDALSFQWDIPSNQLDFSTKNNPIPTSSIKGDNKEVYSQDLNNDGLTDIVVANRDNNLTFEIFLNRGEANFTKINTNLQSTFKSAALNFIDANSDGFIDVVITDTSGLNVWYINDKKINFQGANFVLASPQILQGDLSGSPARKKFFFIDYNGDARPDFFIIDNVSSTAILYENQSDSLNTVRLSKRTDLNLGIPTASLKDYMFFPIDLDNDGKTDLFSFTRNDKDGTLQVFKNQFSGSNQVFSITNTGLDKNFFNVYPDTYQNTGLGQNNNFAYNGYSYMVNNNVNNIENILTPKFSGIRNPRFVDINGDGLLDIVISVTHNHWYNANNVDLRYIQIEKVYQIINKGNFTFESPKIISTPVNNIDIGIGNPNCHLDDCGNSRCYLGFFNAYLRYNSGNGQFTRYTNPPHNYPTGTIYYEHPRYFADLNNDGKSDFIVRQFDIPNSSISPVLFNTNLTKVNSLCSGLAMQFSYSRDFNLDFGKYNRFGTDLLFYNIKTGENRIHVNNGDGRPPVITAFYGQLGGDVFVEYSTMNDPEVYVKGTSRSYPDIDFSSSSRIVKSYSKYDSGFSQIAVVHSQYKYSDGVINLTGRGFRGFKKIEVLDLVQGFKVVKEFEEDSRFIASNLKSQKTYASSGQLLSEEIYKNVTWITRSDGSGNIYVPFNANTFQDKIFTPFPEESISRTYDLNGSLLSENKSRMYMDAFGNVVYQVFEHGDGCIDSIYHEYINDWEKWFIGRLSKSSLFKNCPGSSEIIRESEYEYHPITGFLVKETSEPNQNERIKTVKTYERDVFGNITRTTEQAWNGNQVVTRIKTSKFDPLGRYQTESTNHLGHKISVKVDPYRGLPLETTDENGLVTKMRYNAFGILREIEYPDGTVRNIDSQKRRIGFSDSFVFSTWATNEASSSSETDLVGRVLNNSRTLFDGNSSVKSNYYNEENRLQTVYYPYSVQDFEYDIAGRVVKSLMSGNNNSTLEYLTNYSGLIETVVNPLQQTMSHVKDVRQRLIQVTDNAGNQIAYKYDIQGNISQIVAGNNEYIINYEYDVRGRLTAMIDPVLGREEYSYDGFGNLLSKKDGNGNLITYTYDELNRVKSLTQAEGVVSYTYDEGTKAIGKLSRVTYPNYESNLTYDDLGRIQQNTIIIQGQSHLFRYHYNSIGKIDRVEHPSGIILKFHYNQYSFLSKITNNQSGKLLWEIKKVDLNNRITEEALGNGVINSYEFDIQDNLTRIRSTRNNAVIQDLEFLYNEINLITRKTDHKNNITEDYHYDNLNRLIFVTTSGQVNEELSMTYDKWGNIKTKSDLGTYHYSTSVPTLLERIDFFDTDCSLPSSKFDYEYTSFNKISKISGDSVRLEITYGPNNQRLIQRLFIHNQLYETRIYVTDDYEIISINNIETKRFSIHGSASASVVFEVAGNQPGKYNYLHKDNLGTVTVITNDFGAVQYSYSFDVWGKRRIINQADNVFGNTYRGFTGHEHIAILELINMNGRIYDPIMARFISPDPFISENNNFQNFNRFSYVYNNPVNFTDPSGYFVKKLIREVIDGAIETIGRVGSGIVNIANGNIRDGLKNFGQYYIDVHIKWVGGKELDKRGRQAFGDETWNQIVVASATIVVAYATGGFGAAGAKVTLSTAIMSGAAAGAAGGATGAYLSGAGTNDILKAGFKGAVISGATAGLTHGIGTGISSAKLDGTWFGEGLRALGHGAVQGSVNELQGGKFSSGFMSGFVSSIGSHTQGLYGSNPVGRVFASSIVGGTVSSITGGKFATGAVTGAFVEMFNQMSHKETLQKIENWHNREGGMTHKQTMSLENSNSLKGMKPWKWIAISSSVPGLIYKAIQPSSIGVSTMPNPPIFITPTPTPSPQDFNYKNHLH